MGGERKVKFVGELMRPFRGKNAVSRDRRISIYCSWVFCVIRDRLGRFFGVGVGWSRIKRDG